MADFASLTDLEKYSLLPGLFAVALGAILWFVWIRQRRELWLRPIKDVCAIIALAAATTLIFDLHYDSLESQPELLLMLQLAKDVPGLLLVALVVEIVRRKATTLPSKPPLLTRLMDVCPWVFGCALILAALAAYFGGTAFPLEDGASASGVMYRVLVFGPMALYSLLLFWLLAEDSVAFRPFDRRLSARYAFFSGGALIWVALAVDHLARPSLIRILDPAARGASAAAADGVVLLLWLSMACCWVGGYAARYMENRADRGLALTASYRWRSTEISSWISDAEPRRRKPGWRRCNTELAKTVRALACHEVDGLGSSPNGPMEVEEKVSRAGVAYALLAHLADRPSDATLRGRSELQALRLAHKYAARELPDGSPDRTRVCRDPLVAAIEPVLRLTDEPAPTDLQGDPEWIQATAYLAAEAGLLPPRKQSVILNPSANAVSKDVPRVLKDVRFELARRRVV